MSRSHRRETAEYRIGRARRQPYSRREIEREERELLLELAEAQGLERVKTGADRLELSHEEAQ